MVTAEEIGAVTIFAGLALEERERLARVAADITLQPGEYAAHPGAERALFGLLDGRIEAVQLVDGIERIVGSRSPGDVFGEVPITLGTVFPVGFRATERLPRLPDRGARLPPRRRGRARGRGRGRPPRRPPHQRRGGPLGARGGTAAAPRRRPRPSPGSRPAPSYAGSSTGTRSYTGGSRPTSRTPSSNGAGRCPRRASCPRSASSTTRPSSSPTSARWRGCSGSTPTRCSVRSCAASPSSSTSAPRRAGRSTTWWSWVPGLPGSPLPSTAPPRGSTCSSSSARRPGGQAGTSSRIENYLGFADGVSGDELASRALKQARRLGAEIVVTRVDHGDRHDHARAAARRRRRHPRPDDHPRLRRHLAAARDRGLRPAPGEGDLLRRRAQRGVERPRARRPHRRRGQLRRAGGDVLLDLRAERQHPLPRRRAAEEHVALPDRPAREPRQHPGAAPHGDRRRARRRLARGDRRPRRRGGHDVEGRLGRRLHLHRRRRGDRVAPGRDRARPERVRPHRVGRARRRRLGARPRPLPARDERPGDLRVRRRPLRAGEAVAAAVGEGSMAIAFVHQFLRDAAVQRAG